MFYRTIPIKLTIDEFGKFYEGSKIPVILVQSKSDLNEGNFEKVKEIAEKNGFLKAFKTSSKTGENINEAMDCLLGEIINKMKYCESKRIEILPDKKKNFKIPERFAYLFKKKKKSKKLEKKEIDLKDILFIKEEFGKLNLSVENLLNKYIPNNSFLGFTNTIVKREDEAEDILNLICRYKQRKINLLYSASMEENTKEDFHNKCDNKGSTIILVETVKGKRFGVYSSLSWKCNDKWVNDPFCFLFTIKDNKKIDIKDTKHAYFGSSEYGPKFGEDDILGLYNNNEGGFLDVVHKLNDEKKTFDIEKNSDICEEGTYVMAAFEVYQVST